MKKRFDVSQHMFDLSEKTGRVYFINEFYVDGHKWKDARFPDHLLVLLPSASPRKLGSYCNIASSCTA